MKDWTQIQERYLQDDLPVRLGGLAANLSRIKSFSSNDDNQDAVESLIEESKFFIEWTAGEAKIEAAEQLVDLQIQLAIWQYSWDKVWQNLDQRQQMVNQSSEWTQKVLELSGLLG